MSRITGLGSLAVSSCVLAWGGKSWADEGIRPHLGLEVALISSTSAETTVAAPSGTSSGTEVKYESSSSRSGLPGPAAISLGLLVSDHVDLGVRLGYSTSTDKSGTDNAKRELETSSYTVSPYIAYLTGARGDMARFTFGLTGGIGSGTSKSTSPGGAATTSTTTESTTGIVHYGAIAGLRLHASDLLSFDPMLMVFKTSLNTEQPDTADVKASGVTFMLSVGFSAWLGGAPPAATAATTPAPAPAEGAEATEAPAGPAAESESTSSIPEPAAEAAGRTTLNFGDGRAMTLIAGEPGPDRTISFVLRETLSDSNLETCTQVVLHPSEQQELEIEGKPGKATSPLGPVLVLKGQVTMEQLRRMTASPGNSSATAPDHWIDVCGHHWNLLNAERVKLKVYLDSLR